MSSASPRSSYTGSPELHEAVLSINTTSGSLIHRLAGLASRRRLKRPPSIIKAYVGAAAITYVPLLLSALFGPLPMAAKTPTLHLPFLLDLNLAFMFLVSFPSVIVLVVNDQYLLNASLQRIQADGIVSLSEGDAVSLATRWRKKFHTVNILSQVIGLAVGCLVAFFNYLAYTPASVGFWIADRGRLLPGGYLFLWSIFLFYALIPIYFVRSLAISQLLNDLVKDARIRMLPLHPDRCGGLRPVGQLGLRNQYGLTVLGLNIVILALVSLFNLGVSSTLYGLMIAALVGYIILGPIVFMGPLLPFRAGMLRTKAELMSEVAQRLRVELQRLRSQLLAGAITKEDEELIDRLRKIGTLIDELPVWPFDAGTLRKFLTAYVVPILSAVAYPVLRAIFGILVRA